MSLINQVLQDLEKRRASEPELQGLPPHVRAVPPARRGLPVAATLGILLAGAVIAAVFFYGSQMLLPYSREAAMPAAPTVAVPAPSVVPAEPPPEDEAAFASIDVTLPAPVSRLSDELSFVPESRPRKQVNSDATAARPRPAPPPAGTGEERPVVGEPSVAGAAPKPAPTAQAAASQPAPEAPKAPENVAANPPETPPVIDKQMRDMTPQQRAEVAFRNGVEQLRDARVMAAEAAFREALREDPNHVAARQALLGLLLEARRTDEAEQLLRTALALNPRQPRHAMVLARLQVDRGEVTDAINTLVGTLPYVQTDPEYHAFLAALLQREGRHRETVDYYRVALQSSPGNGLWLMGLGISLRATNQLAEARDAFQRALETRQLNGELAVFTERQLRELGAPRK